MSEVFTNGILMLALFAVAATLGWTAAQSRVRRRIENAVAQSKARAETNHQRQVQRLRDSHGDLENHAKDLAEKLERREKMMRGMEVADVGALREELRQAKEEIGRLRAGGSAITVPPVSTPLRPSGFQDFVADPQVAARAARAQPAVR